MSYLQDIGYKRIIPTYNRLYDVVHTEKKLTLVFEYLDQDLKQYLDQCERGLPPKVMQVSYVPNRLMCPTNMFIYASTNFI